MGRGEEEKEILNYFFKDSKLLILPHLNRISQEGSRTLRPMSQFENSQDAKAQGGSGREEVTECPLFLNSVTQKYQVNMQFLFNTLVYKHIAT